MRECVCSVKKTTVKMLENTKQLWILDKALVDFIVRPTKRNAK